ncbi:MAG: APA family basic amino acid/polyamine antiporter [Candidatus Paceibacteria bacterium]|jgi:APA family basic amino acid/polyamine antiporter
MPASQPSQGLRKYISLRSGVYLVVANMIGAGIFTTTGFQAADIGDPRWILPLWLVGGLLAFCGALCFAELGAAMPEAGGEYAYLRNTYGPALGFMSAIISLTAGFSAPIAAACKAFARYWAGALGMRGSEDAMLGPFSAEDFIALGLVWLLVIIQLRGTKIGLRFLNGVTILKIAGIVLILLLAVVLGEGSLEHFTQIAPKFATQTFAERQSALGTALIFVMFCYSGWNASAYFASEFENPQRDVPRSLLFGTGAVVCLYLGLNAMYFYGAPAEVLAGQTEVGLVAARNLFGKSGTMFTMVILLVSLLASASAMTMAGPRVYYAFGKDNSALSFLGRTSVKRGVPYVALLVQGVVTSAILLAGRIDQIMQYAGFSLALFSSLAVSCVLVLRWRQPDLPRPFRTWGYPFTPLIFLASSCWMMFWSAQGRPLESALALATVVIAGLVFTVLSKTSRNAS